MDKLSEQQSHAKAAIKQEQSDASISSVEREQARRSANMAAIRSKDTKPEMIVRRGLWKRGFRYRLNHKRLPGHPDLVLRKYRTCIFVNGCFWHGHKLRRAQSEELRVKSEEFTLDYESSECCKIPKTNREFWVAKIRRNKERDKEEQRRLAEMGWHCITVWECDDSVYPEPYLVAGSWGEDGSISEDGRRGYEDADGGRRRNMTQINN